MPICISGDGAPSLFHQQYVRADQASLLHAFCAMLPSNASLRSEHGNENSRVEN